MNVTTSDPLPMFERTDDDVQAMIELADLILAESRQWVDDIGVAIEERDGDALALSAESLKCSLAAFHLDDAFAKAARIEELARHGEWERLKKAAAELASACAVARKAVRRWRAKAE